MGNSVKRSVLPLGCGHWISSQSIFVRLPEAQDHARIVRREIAAAANLELVAL